MSGYLDGSFLERHWRRALLGVLAVCVLLHFAPLENHLDNDDAWNYVLEADRVLAGEGSSWAEGGSYLLHQNALRLFVSITYVARWAAFGLWMPGWHLPGIVFHGVNAMLLCMLLFRLGASRGASIVGGLLWGLSPLHPFTVAWIGGNYDVFAGTFALGTLLAFLSRRTTVGVLLLLGALTSKETGVLVIAVLGLLWLLYERSDGWAAGAKRLWPYAAATAGVLAFRLLQVSVGGSIDQAGLPARTIGLSIDSLGYVGPVSLLAGMGVLVHSVVGTTSGWTAVATACVLAVGLGAFRKSIEWRFIFLAAGAGWLLLVPVLLLREHSIAMRVHDLLHHARYLYLPTMLVSGVLGAALVGGRARPNRVGSILAAGLVGLSLYASGKSVARLTQLDPAAGVVAEAVLAADVAADSDVWVFANIIDQGPYRLLMSRWLGWKTKATVHLVQRGWWRVLQRKDDLPFGLDFQDYYVTEGARFDPGQVADGDTVFLLRHGGPAGGHAMPQVALNRARKVSKGDVKRLDLQWTLTTSERAGNVVLRKNGRAEFTLTAADEQPTDYTHRPAILSQELWLSTDRLWGLRLRYRAVGAPKRQQDESVYARGYAELHWTAEGVRAADSYVVLPLVFDGLEHDLDVPLWFDPVWRSSRQIARLGFHPYDLAAEVTLLSISTIVAKKERR